METNTEQTPVKYDVRKLKNQIKELNLQIQTLKDNMHQPFYQWIPSVQNLLMNLKHQVTLLHMARAQIGGHLHCSRYTQGLGKPPRFYGWKHRVYVDHDLQTKLTSEILKGLELQTVEIKAA